jgi:hypothetical protein
MQTIRVISLMPMFGSVLLWASVTKSLETSLLRKTRLKGNASGASLGNSSLYSQERAPLCRKRICIRLPEDLVVMALPKFVCTVVRRCDQVGRKVNRHKLIGTIASVFVVLVAIWYSNKASTQHRIDIWKSASIREAMFLQHFSHRVQCF